jgi:Bax protein
MLLRPTTDFKTAPPPTGHRRLAIAAKLIVIAALAAALVIIHRQVGSDLSIQWARTTPPFVGTLSVAKPRGFTFATAAEADTFLHPVDLEAIRRGDMAVPPLYLARVPDDLLEYASADEQKELFFRFMLPLVLKVNAEIGRLRERLEDIKARQDEPLTEEDETFLKRLHHWYGGEDGSIDDLLERVDIVPPSLALAQSLEESGWGKSRFARIANALFGQHAFSPDKPQVPHPIEGMRPIRAFPDLISSISTYMHNLNSHRAYAEFRALRKAARDRGEPLNGRALAGTLVAYSVRGEDYIADIQRHIDDNKLWEFDTAALDE